MIFLYIYIYIGFKTFFYVVRHLDFIVSYLPTGLHLGFFRSWPSLFLPSSFSLVFLVLFCLGTHFNAIFGSLPSKINLPYVIFYAHRNITVLTWHYK